MRLRVLSLLASREVRASVRGRWFIVGSASFALLAVAVARLGMNGAEQWGIHALDRTAAALLNLVLLFVPLLTLPLGAASFAGEAEDGTLGVLVAQPLSRGEVFLGKLLGLCGAMTLSLALGFGAAAVLVGARGGVSGATFAALAGGAWALGIVTTTLGALLSIAARTRARALAAAMACWIALVFLCDFGVLALAASQVLGATALFGVTIANPLEAVKTLAALAISERLEVLGPVGLHAVKTLGRPGLALLLGGTLVAWTAIASTIAHLRFRRENLA
jgi:ABC-type transport system involved in multi-copper enzyme maturation permease subunit